MTDSLDAVRELHGPAEDGWLRCAGCDAEGYDAEEPTWPCRTAELVYAPQEIADITEASAWFRKWDRQMRHRNPAPSRNFASWLDAAYMKVMENAMRSDWLSRGLTNAAIATPSGKTVTFKIVNQLPISKALLDDR